MPDIFLSYSRDDQTTARRFAEGFERAGFSVWWDQALNPGEAFDRVTEQALDDAKVVVVLWSKRSVDSRWVRAEATQALSGNKLAPVMIEPCKRPIMFELTQTAELAHWKGEVNDPVWQAFIAGLRRLVDKGSDSTTSTPIATHTNAPSRLSKHKQAVVLGGLALVIAIAGAGYVLKPGTAPAANAEAKTAPAAAQSEEHSIVVLPFRDNSDAHDSQAFADGTSEEVSNLLTNIPELKVIGQVSANFFRDKQEELAQMRERLGVEYVLTGSVRKNVDNVRINVQLVDARDSRQLWQNTYDGSLQQAFEFQNNIAKKVAEALQVKLGVGALARRLGMTRNVAAWEEFQKTYFVKGNFDEAMYGEMAKHLERALNLDPEFIAAAASLIEVYEFSKPQIAGKGNEAELQRSRELRALLAKTEEGRIALKSLEANRAFALGDFLAVEKRGNEIKTSLQERGLEFKDDLVPLLMLSTGRYREARALYERRFAVDPLNFETIYSLSMIIANGGEVPKAIAFMKEEQKKFDVGTPAYLSLMGGRLVQYLAMHDIDSLQNLKSTASTVRVPQAANSTANINGAMLTMLDNRESALAGLKERLAMPNMGGLSLAVASVWAAYFDDPQLALDFQLDLAKKAALIGRMDIFRPNYAAMRKLPGFKQLVKDLGLVDYWRASGNWGDFCQPLPNTETDFECH